MPQVDVFPASEPRLVLQGDLCVRRSPIYRHLSSRSRLLWRICGATRLPAIGWTRAHGSIAENWRAVAEHLHCRPDSMIGVLGHPGPQQKLVVLGPGHGVAKLPLGAGATNDIENELENLRALRARGFDQLCPSVQRWGAGLTMNHVAGSHPLWHDKLAHQFISEGFGADKSNVPLHGDVTPWNLVKTATGFTILDWEKAQIDRNVEPSLNVLDYVFRGGAVADASSREVCRVVMESIRGRVLQQDAVLRALRNYSDYRKSISASSDAIEIAARKYATHVLRILEPPK